MNSFPNWYYYQINGWIGKWSKSHFFTTNHLTVCGLIVYPEIGTNLTPHYEGKEKCKKCEKIISSKGILIYCKIGTNSQTRMKLINQIELPVIGQTIYIKDPDQKFSNSIRCKVDNIINLGYELYLLEMM